jgi:hypothetical protein
MKQRNPAAQWSKVGGKRNSNSDSSAQRVKSRAITSSSAIVLGSDAECALRRHFCAQMRKNFELSIPSLLSQAGARGTSVPGANVSLGRRRLLREMPTIKFTWRLCSSLPRANDDSVRIIPFFVDEYQCTHDFVRDASLLPANEASRNAS